MTSLSSSSSWLCSLHTPKHNTTTYTFLPKHRPLKICAFSLNDPKEGSSPEPSSSNGPKSGEEEPKPARVKLAFETALKYKKSLKLDPIQQISQDPLSKTAEIVSGNGDSGGGQVEKNDDNFSGDGGGEEKEIPEAVRIAMEKAREYRKNKGAEGSDNSGAESKNLAENGNDGKKEVPEAVRVALEKAKEYKKKKGNVDDNTSDKESDELPADKVEKEGSEALRIAMGKAMEYKKNKGTMDSGSSDGGNRNLTGVKVGGANNSGSTSKKEGLKISGIDFVGLNFADKKESKGLPAGLVPVADPFPEGDLPEVEFLVGDAGNFGKIESAESTTYSEEETPDLYKPKVTTWGMFPRPNNISKTFGGGRTIRPGDALENPEDRAAKEARTRQLLAAYKRKFGINMDPKLKAECEKALKDGDSLMDVGRLAEALPYYQQVMDNLGFQTELHGLAALQWSICQDSLNRSEKARAMYEKLQSHPNALVSKKARQFMFSFQAMEMMKVSRSTSSLKNTDYQGYFEAFVEDKPNATRSTEEEEGTLNQALPYIIFLAFPILLVLLVAARKGT